MSEPTKDEHNQSLASDIAEYHTLVNGLANRIADLERAAERQAILVEDLASTLATLYEMYKGK